jgi:hypothetical protein
VINNFIKTNGLIFAIGENKLLIFAANKLFDNNLNP